MPNTTNRANNQQIVKSEKSKTSFKPRLLTLCCKDRKRDEENDQWYYTPTVTLAGQWLYDAGFRSGQRIELVIENRQILMRVESEPSDYPTKEQLTIQIKRLEKQLRQIPDETETKQPVRTHKVKTSINNNQAVFAK